jgi:hypothetical protein
MDESWMNARNFFKVPAFSGLGWNDIPAFSIDFPDNGFMPEIKY